MHVDRNYAHLLIHFYFIVFLFTICIYIYTYTLYVAPYHILHRLTIIYRMLHIYYIKTASCTHIVFFVFLKSCLHMYCLNTKKSPVGGIKFYLLRENISGSAFLSDLVTSHPSTCATPRSSQLSPFLRLDSILARSIEQSQRQHWGLS